ncbi:NAD-dependent epimerase/dehydratase family protein [Liquorilactobacillus sucicola]|uniref:NAD-dependent epimerase/dehydratase family protein n=1 Tax=Liquorilactobacillus sucicola TaxID=519050 RepID=UPI000704C764|nr:NAD-dependent epimerase/dehydratase family protein [Liquorilactobacillus sucicola]
MKVLLIGGSGFVGRGILQYLAADSNFDLISISRSGRPHGTQAWLEQVTWIRSDLNHDENWKKYAAAADWVLDLIGVLIEKNYHEYQQKSVTPAKELIKYLHDKDVPTKLLFVSAKHAPFFMKNYMRAKKEVEADIMRKLPDRGYIVYPGMIYAQERKMVYFSAELLKLALRIPVLKQLLAGYEPIKRTAFSREIRQILLGHDSFLLQDQYR